MLPSELVEIEILKESVIVHFIKKNNVLQSFTVISIPNKNALQNIASNLILLFTASFVYYFYVPLFITASPAALQIT
jgi:hypothetical protein